MTEWITDRLPSAEDCKRFACEGFVMIPANNDRSWDSAVASGIKLGQPWAPWPKMPPFEPEPEYWSKPSDIPAKAIWFLDYDGDCDMIQTVTSWGLILAQDIKIKWEDLSEWRWSDRPFDRFKDGKPCTKGGDA